ncbi:hypothetical protein DE146DRAFT_295085 [Phaeosphaeria sp. MPI-PUGE-AT-0046c]|nr:hypothetical protein DE146DRAFT_295085 [Phaeosphaeria sp. MPI-PUGE-AT-0046c]
MPPKNKGKGKVKAKTQPGPEHLQEQAARHASLSPKGLGSPSSANSGPQPTLSRIPLPVDLNQAMSNLSITDTGTLQHTVPITLPTNTGSIAASGSPAQADIQSIVPNVPLRDAAHTILKVPSVSVQPPASTGSATNGRRPETIYTPAIDFGPIVDMTSRLQKQAGKLDYPVRASLRPTQGQNERVVTNHFELVVDEGITFYEYQIVGIPDREKCNTRKRLVTTAVEDVDFLRMRKADFASDYFDTIISWVALHDFATGPKVHSHDPTIPGSCDEWRLVDVVDRGETIRLNLRLNRVVDFDGFRSFTKSTHADPATFNPELTRKALHIIITKCIQDQRIFHLNTNKFFVENAFQDLCGRNDVVNTLRAIRGYHYKINAGMGKILLNVTSVTSAFWNPNLVSEVLSGGLKAVDGNIFSLKGLQVHIEYERGKAGRDAKDGKAKKNGKAVDQGNGDEHGSTGASGINDQHSRIKRIRGFGEPVNVQMFQWTPRDDNGNPTGPAQRISIAKYLRDVYGQTLQYPNEKAVDLGTGSEHAWFAPEHLRILPNQIYTRVIPDSVAKIFHEMSCKKPQSTRSCIEKEGLVHFPLVAQVTTNVGGTRMASLRGCPPVKLNPTMLKIPCTKLPSVRIEYHESNTTLDERSGRWNLNRRKFLYGASLSPKWKLLYGPSVSATACKKFIEHFEEQLVQTGVCKKGQIEHLGSHTALPSPQAAMETRLKEALQALHDASLGPKGKTPDLVVLLLQKKDQDVYSSFKYLTDKVYCFQSICATEDNFRPKDFKDRNWKPVPGWENDNAMRQYMAHVAMKANIKLYGVNHTAVGVAGLLGKTLVLGADLTHPGPGAIDSCPSISSVVSSVENSGGWFLGQSFLQPKSEIVHNLQNAVEWALKRWVEENKAWPENVLYYRDGVAESQYDEIKQKENSAIERAWNQCVQKESSDTNVPLLRLTTVIVTKRHSTRFFPEKAADAMPNNENCKPGLLVEGAVTHPYYGDFYLQTHNAIKGTARPCHYFVLRNDMGISMSDLEQFTHSLCHTYVRATVGVSYAPPTYYADRLCERGRCYLREFFSPNPATKQEWDMKRRQFQADVRRTRAAANKQAGIEEQDRRGKRRTEKELDQEKEDAEKVGRMMFDAIRGPVLDRWNVKAIDKVAADRKNNYVETMYWM